MNIKVAAFAVSEKSIYTVGKAWLFTTYAVIRGRFNITVKDYLHAQNQGKLASVCLQRFSSIFETTIPRFKKNKTHFFPLIGLFVFSLQ